MTASMLASSSMPEGGLVNDALLIRPVMTWVTQGRRMGAAAAFLRDLTAEDMGGRDIAASGTPPLAAHTNVRDDRLESSPQHGKMVFTGREGEIEHGGARSVDNAGDRVSVDSDEMPGERPA